MLGHFRLQRWTRLGLSAIAQGADFRHLKSEPLKSEPARGLEPLTTALQERCAANCATPAALAV